MSEPLNHHFVSQCQSKRFFNTTKAKIFVLDKKTKKIFDKPTTKSLFSEDDSNTRTNDDLTLNRQLLEKDLKDNFEDHYERHYNLVQAAISNPDKPPFELKQSLIALTKFAIIGELRHPISKKGTDDALSQALFERVLPQAAPQLKDELLALKHRLDQTKYSNSIIYSKFADDAFKLMIDIRSLIHVIDCNKFFLLPDTSAMQWRGNITDSPNPDTRVIGMVGIPLSSRIFLHSQSIKLGNQQDGVIIITEDIFPGRVERINYGLYDNSYEQVACEDYDYLVQFRDNLDAIREMCLDDKSQE